MDVADPQGGWPGPHYAVILSPNDAIDAGEPLVVAVISDEFRLARPDQIVMLLGRPNGLHPITKLFNKCGVMCAWLAVVSADEILSYHGKVVPPQLTEILRIVGDLPE